MSSINRFAAQSHWSHSVQTTEEKTKEKLIKLQEMLSCIFHALLLHLWTVTANFAGKVNSFNSKLPCRHNRMRILLYL